MSHQEPLRSLRCCTRRDIGALDDALGASTRQRTVKCNRSSDLMVGSKVTLSSLHLSRKTLATSNGDTVKRGTFLGSLP